MRIVGGRFKGRTIRIPNNLPVRPTTDMAKEALFNILNNRVDLSELEVLDLFCGTGNISYEFQSREVVRTTSVDSNFQCITVVKKTMAELGCSNAVVIRSEVIRFLQTARQKWDLIFADPPYDFPSYPELVDTIMNGEILSAKGTLIVEHPGTIDLEKMKGYRETRNYGRVHFSFFELEA